MQFSASAQLSIPFAVNTTNCAVPSATQPLAAMARLTAACTSASNNGLATLPRPPGYAVVSVQVPPNVDTFFI